MVVVDTEDAVRAGESEHRSPPALTLSLPRLLDGLWLLALMIYALAGMRLTPFHGDETNHIFNSHDFATLFIHHRPQDLILSPPYKPETAGYFRVLDATLPRYAFGAAWSLAGLSEADLPSGPWLWAMDYPANVAQNRLPTGRLLDAARLASTLFLCLSIAIMFELGRRFGERPLAYLSSGLYALNPLILLNGRRAMQEGMLLGFGLLTILIAASISRKQEQSGRSAWHDWLGLALAASLALGSKNSGILYVAGAFGWIFFVEVSRRHWRSLLETSARLAASGVIAMMLLVALSPGLWADPLARLADMVTERRKAMQMQVDVNLDAPTTLSERVTGIITQPFLTPARYYEVFFWADFAPITEQIGRYEASHLDGLRFGKLLGIPLTVLACLGIGAMLWPRVRPSPSGELSIGLLVWPAVMAAAALANPLPWQRYYLQLIPPASLLAGIGIVSLARLALGYAQKRRGSLTKVDRA